MARPDRRNRPPGSGSPTPTNGPHGPRTAAGSVDARFPNDYRLVVLLCAVSAVYLVLFFLAAELPLRRQLFSYLVIPDQLVRQWMGGTAARIAVLDRSGPFGLAALQLGLAWLGGRLVLDALRLQQHLTRIEVFSLSCGIGLAGWSLVTLGLGLAGWLHPLAYAVPAAAVVAVSGWRVRQQSHRWLWAGHQPSEVDDSQVATWAWKFWIAMAIVLTCFTFAGAALPPFDFDVVEYHLQVPKEWFQQGHIGFLAHNVYGNMPLGAELHALQAMVLWPGADGWWWGALAGKIVIAAYGPLTALLLWSAGCRWLNRWSASVAVVAYLSTPWIAQASMVGWIEGALAYYLAAAALVLAVARGAANAPSAWRWSTAVGLLAGAAAACKYPALVFVVVPISAGVLVLPGRRAATLLAFWLAVTVACGPWYLKNAALAGNPVYPLLGRQLGGRTRTLERIEQWDRAHQVPRDALGRRYTGPRAWRYLTSALYRSYGLSPLLGCLLPMALLVRPRWWFTWTAALLLLFILVVWWTVTHRLDRFLLPALPLASWLAAIGAGASQARLYRRIVGLLLIVAVTFNFSMITSRAMGDNRFLVSLADLRSDEPLDVDDGFSLRTPVHRYLNRQAASVERVLLVGDAAVFDLEMPIVYDTCFDASRFETWFAGKSTAQRREILQQQRISHVVIDWSEIQRYRNTYGFTDYVTTDRIAREFVDTGLLRPAVVPGVDPRLVSVFLMNDE